MPCRIDTDALDQLILDKNSMLAYIRAALEDFENAKKLLTILEKQVMASCDCSVVQARNKINKEYYKVHIALEYFLCCIGKYIPVEDFDSRTKYNYLMHLYKDEAAGDEESKKNAHAEINRILG